MSASTVTVTWGGAPTDADWIDVVADVGDFDVELRHWLLGGSVADAVAWVAGWAAERGLVAVVDDDAVSGAPVASGGWFGAINVVVVGA